MQGLGQVGARALARTARPLLVAMLAIGGVVATAPRAGATIAPRPAISSPFSCGQTWFARTYSGHPSFAVDWNLPGGGEADYGQPVLAGARGVATVEQHVGYGNKVTIDHGGGWTSLYAHLSSIVVANGQVVEPNTVVGHVGNTGRSDGSHLHQEQLLNGVRQQVVVDGTVIHSSLSSRGASYASGNCAEPAASACWPSLARVRGCGTDSTRPLP